MSAIALDVEEGAKLASRLTDDIRQAAADAGTHWDAVAANRELLKNEQPRENPPWEGACELVVPYVKQAKFALLSHFCPTLLGTDPVFHVEGSNAFSKKLAEKVETFLQAQLSRQVKFRRKMERLFDAALRDGTGIAHIYWSTVRRKQPAFVHNVEEVIDAETGAIIQPAGSVTQVEEEKLVYDAPQIDIIPLERFGTFPVANADIQDSPGVFVRAAITGEEVLQRLAAGEFDADAVAKLRELEGDEGASSTADGTLRGISDNVSDQQFLSRTYTLTQVYYKYSPEFRGQSAILPASKTGTVPEIPQDWLFVLHEPSGIMLQARPSPWFHQQRPFVAISPYQDVEGFYGDSLASAGAGHVQLGKTTLLRLAVDAASIGISPELLVAASLGKHIADIKKRRGPGGVIPFPDAYFENNSTKMQPFGSNGYAPSMVVPMMGLLDQEGQMSTGVSDTLKGIPNPGNISATEAQQIMESSQKIVAFLTERLADGLADIGDMAYKLNYQFQGNEGPQELWGVIYGDQPELTLFGVMQGSYLVTTSGIRDTNNRAILAKRAMERLQMLMNEPMVMGNPERRYALMYDALLANGTADPERYLGPVEEWVQAQQMQAQAGGGMAWSMPHPAGQ